MSQKTIKRILYGLVALALVVVALREMAQAGLNAESAMAGSIGVVFAFMAITGAG